MPCPFGFTNNAANKGVDHSTLRPQRSPEAVYYGDYLQLDKLLDSQLPKSKQYAKDGGKGAHDEMLFIIIHQTYELWFKLILHELDSVLEFFSKPQLSDKSLHKAVHRLRRITEIQRVLVSQMKVLETMTPMEFLEFRDFLFPASGFQSLQFRLLENKLGLPTKQRISYSKKSYCSALNDKDTEAVRASEKGPTLFQCVNNWLERTPFLACEDFHFWSVYRNGVQSKFARDRKVVKENVYLSELGKEMRLKEIHDEEQGFNVIFDEKKYEEQRARGKRRLSFKAQQAAVMILQYCDQTAFQLPHQLINQLVDIDENMTSWRYAHAEMVQRMLGLKIGTGGSSGVHYLKATATYHKVFEDFSNLSMYLIPKELLPPLPRKVTENMSFVYRLQTPLLSPHTALSPSNSHHSLQSLVRPAPLSPLTLAADPTGIQVNLIDRLSGLILARKDDQDPRIDDDINESISNTYEHQHPQTKGERNSASNGETKEEDTNGNASPDEKKEYHNEP